MWHEVPSTEEEIHTLGDDMLTLRDRINLLVRICDDTIADFEETGDDPKLPVKNRGWYEGGTQIAKLVKRWLTEALNETKEGENGNASC